jgi:tetratricopeptide (TPR) repeat protein
MSLLRDLLKNKPPGEPTAAAGDADAELLEAGPIPRKRMDLLWLDPPRLAQVGQALAQHEVVRIQLMFGSSRHELEIAREDHAWARQIEKVVDRAFEAGQTGDYLRSIEAYKEALRMAPGCDLFLMSVGVNYAFLGQKAKSLQFLERAASISPNNDRIRENLERARRA